MEFKVKASTGHANGRGAIPGNFKGAGRERARPGRAEGTGGIEVHIKRGGAIPPIVSFYIKLLAKESPWHANGIAAIPVHAKGAGANYGAAFNPYQIPQQNQAHGIEFQIKASPI